MEFNGILIHPLRLTSEGFGKQMLNPPNFIYIESLMNQSISFKEFTTVLTTIEACINTRPLSALSNDPSDIQVLTPSHFNRQKSSFLA